MYIYRNINKKNENNQINTEFKNFINNTFTQKIKQLNYDDNHIPFSLLKKFTAIIFALTLPYLAIEYFKQQKKENNDDNIRYDIIIPVKINDVNPLPSSIL